MIYGQGIFRIIHDERGWCVAKRTDSNGYWQRVSEFYKYRGWAQAFARRRKLNVQNYASKFA